MADDQSKQEQLARRIVVSASDAERQALKVWAQGLLDIRAKNLPMHKAAAMAITHTVKSDVILPVVKQMGRELKRIGWDDRSWKTRLGMGAVVATVATVGNAGAGIAALGGAIGVPLWIVIGAGATFAGAIIDAVMSETAQPRSTYSVIDAKKESRKRAPPKAIRASKKKVRKKRQRKT